MDRDRLGQAVAQADAVEPRRCRLNLPDCDDCWRRPWSLFVCK